MPERTTTEGRRVRVEGFACEGIAYPTREAWLDARRGSYGASEIPTMMGLGLSSYYELWAIRTGRIEAPDLEGNRAIQRGRVMEPLVAQWYAEETGRSISDPGDYTIVRNPEFPLIHATLDRVIAPCEEWHQGRPGVLELKTTRSRNWWRWASRPPDEVIVQLATQILIAGTTWGTACVSIDEDLTHTDLERDPEFEAEILTAVERFDWYVRQDREPPVIDGSEKTRKALEAVWPREERSSDWIDLPREADELADSWLACQEEITSHLEAIDYAKVRITQLIGGARGGQTPDGRRFSAARGLRWTNIKQEIQR